MNDPTESLDRLLPPGGPETMHFNNLGERTDGLFWGDTPLQPPSSDFVMPAFAMRRGLAFLSILLAATGCVTSNQNASPAQPASAAEKKAAMDTYMRCLYKNAHEMDDGRSDARTVAIAVRGVCRNFYMQVQEVYAQGENAQVRRAFYERSANDDLSDATVAVLKIRANAGKPPAANYSAPAPTSRPAAVPPPMIPPS